MSQSDDKGSSDTSSWKELQVFFNWTGENDDEKEKQKKQDRYEPEYDCMLQLDYWMRCAGIVSQLNSIYRYGERQTCSQWKDGMFFCVMNAWRPEPERERILLERRRDLQQHRKRPTTIGTIWQAKSENTNLEDLNNKG